MQQAHVYSRGILAGVLSKDSTGYQFQYLSDYLAQDSQEYPPISLNFPKQKSAFKSNFVSRDENLPNSSRWVLRQQHREKMIADRV
jgi:HipA-like protein